MNALPQAASSGTSMAAPQIAGVAALILSARGKNLNGLSIRSRLASTARVVWTDFGKGVLESEKSLFRFSIHSIVKYIANSPHLLFRTGTVHQGGGLVNAFCAVFSNTSVSTSSIALNDSTNMNRHQNFTLVNEGTQPVTYRVKHLPAGSIAAFSLKSQHGRIDSKIPTPYANYASVDIQPDTFTVMPGQKQVIRTKFTPPRGLNPEDLHVYSGYISLVSVSKHLGNR
ncbi:hypothetical protein PGTUg99_033185 [Puccinia graminis f. sp. tritici]|uniref:Peptidase S8/S53 domain-containing protein n=1 Tax=Puccinia graminis f. sp. tritici TaxID=56615 RepID=A0A5B0NJZ7_PUCGR|nr:hypothetical protein PGTUg99_033185 [Puccinia graminis f. sp. tritici]